MTRAPRVLKTMIASTAMVALSTLCPPAASADQEDDPCPLSLALLCRMLPIAPELDGDVDLTKPTVPPDPGAASQEPPAPAAPAAEGSG
jgi:hypothetical protein